MNTIKTSKQIYLLAKEVGEKNKEQFELADEIIIEKANYDSWIGAIQKLTSLNLMPPMNKGVFIVKDSTYTGRLLFECEIEDDGHAEFAFSAFYQPEGDEIYWDFDCKLAIDDIFNAKLEMVWANGFADATSKIMERQNKTDAQIEEYLKNNASKRATGPIVAFLHTNARINYLMEHPEEKEIIKIEGRKPNPVKEKPISYNKKSAASTETDAKITRKVINLNRIIVKTHSEKTIRQIKSRKKSTISWNVRGHIRHYKNGKTVYIKPYEKGKGRKIKKLYEI